MFENPRRGRQTRNFTTNVPKILDLKSSSGQIFSENWRWVPLEFLHKNLNREKHRNCTYISSVEELLCWFLANRLNLHSASLSNGGVAIVCPIRSLWYLPWKLTVKIVGFAQYVLQAEFLVQKDSWPRNSSNLRSRTKRQRSVEIK